MSNISCLDIAGEKRVSNFSQRDLRPSHDWINNKWNHIKDRKDIVSSLLSDKEHENQGLFGFEGVTVQSPDISRLSETEARTESIEPEGIIVESVLTPHGDSWMLNADVPDLVKECHLDGLEWCLSKKRKRRGLASDGRDHSRRQRRVSSSSSQEEAKQSSACGLFMLPTSLTVDHDNCKIGGDPLFSASMTHSSLVMSR